MNKGGAISAYDNDDRVRKVNDYVVSAPDDRYDVSAWKDEHDWYADNALGGRSCRGRKPAQP
jgi:hypothetical protein